MRQESPSLLMWTCPEALILICICLNVKEGGIYANSVYFLPINVMLCLNLTFYHFVFLSFFVLSDRNPDLSRWLELRKAKLYVSNFWEIILFSVPTRWRLSSKGCGRVACMDETLYKTFSSYETYKILLNCLVIGRKIKWYLQLLLWKRRNVLLSHSLFTITTELSMY